MTFATNSAPAHRLAPFQTIAGYRFVPLSELANWREALHERGRRLSLRGTILIAAEGINFFLSGARSALDEFLHRLGEFTEFADLPVKRAAVSDHPFRRWVVRIRPEVIPLGLPQIQPHRATCPRLTPAALHRRLQNGGELILLDVRNDFEIDYGTFEGAQRAGVRHFRDLPQAVELFPESWKRSPVVTFCTGGIRCEKAGPLLQMAGFEDVWQLDGGILNYFEQCGGDYFSGTCFVFDERVAVRPDLHPIADGPPAPTSSLCADSCAREGGNDAW